MLLGASARFFLLFLVLRFVFRSGALFISPLRLAVGGTLTVVVVANVVGANLRCCYNVTALL